MSQVCEGIFCGMDSVDIEPGVFHAPRAIPAPNGVNWVDERDDPVFPYGIDRCDSGLPPADSID